MQAIFLDFDGTLVEKVPKENRGPRNTREMKIREDARYFLENLDPSFLLYVISNQPDISRGLLNPNDWEEIVALFRDCFPTVNDFLFCPHDNTDACFCRKPKPGMILKTVLERQIDPSKCLMVGDSWVDVLCGVQAGTRTLLLETEDAWNPTSQGAPPIHVRPDFSVKELKDSFKLLPSLRG